MAAADLERLERELRSQLEGHVGRPLTDDEWETVKRIQQGAAHAESTPARTAARGWTGVDLAAFVGALIAGLGGAGLYAEWGFVFSPFVKVPLALFVWLIALWVLVFWIRAVFGMGFWDWLIVGIIGVFTLLVPFAAAGWALLVEDRAYLTSRQELADAEFKPTTALATGLVLAAVVMGWAGRPSSLRWVVGSLFAVAFCVGSFLESDHPFALTAFVLLAIAVVLLVDAMNAAAAGNSSRSGPVGLLVLIGALGSAAVHLALDERPLEIALWLPLIALAAIGCVVGAGAFFGGLRWRVRAGRLLGGAVAVAPALAVAAALGVRPW